MAVCATAGSVAVIVGLTQVVGSDRSSGPSPTAPTTSANATPSRGTERGSQGLAAVVDAKDAQVQRVAVTPGDTRRMATIWRRIEDREVLALTDDGFASRTLLEVPPGSQVHALPGGRFVLVDGWQADRIRVLDPDGSSLTVTVSGSEAPLADDEVPVVTNAPGHLRIVGVDADGNAHPVPTPDGLSEVEENGGRLQGIAYAGEQPRYHWSDDGGANWASQIVDAPSLVSSTWSAAGRDHAVVEGADGATLFPLVALHTADASAPDQWTRTGFPDGGQSHWTLDGSWIHDDDGVRLLLKRWSSRGSDNGPLETGIYRVVDGDLVRVPGLRLPADLTYSMLDLQYDGKTTVWFAGPDQDLLRTTDGGETWQSFPAR